MKPLNRRRFWKFAGLILLGLTLLMAGCAGKTAHKPKPVLPPGSKEKKPSAVPAKIPATQRPYTIDGVRYTPIASSDGFVQTGLASWYGRQFHGRKTSNGETYNMFDMTAAHKTLPMNTWVEVHNLENDRKITVRVNDRGPFVKGRIIDLSYTGASRIGILGPGTGQVRVTALGEAVSYSEKTHTPVSFKALDYWTGNFTVQVGAFQIKANADRLRDRLSAAHENAHVVQFTDDRGTFHRVRIGRFAKLKDAEQFTESLITRGEFDSAFVVAE